MTSVNLKNLLKQNLLSPAAVVSLITGNGQNRKKRLIIIAAGALVFIILIALLFSSSGSAVNVPTFKTKKGKLLITITESGEISAKNAVSIVTPRVRGSLKVVFLVTEGTRVKKGETVVQFDPTEALNSLKDAEARLEVAISDKAKLEANHKSALLRAENEVKNAELTFELSKLNLEQMKFEAEIKQREAQLQHRRNELNLIRVRQDLESTRIIQRSEMNKTEIDVQQRRYEVEKAKKDLDQLTLAAPQDGLAVYEQNWSTGRKIAIGDTPWPGMTLVSLPDLSAMQSVTFVNEVDVSRVKRGQKVRVTLDAFRDSSFWGEISNVASLGKSKDGNSSIKVFEIAVSILSQSEILKPGMTTSNKIMISEINNVITVPHEAVYEKGKQQVVYVKNGSGFDEHPVTLGAKGEDMLIITSGLKPGDEVALVDPTLKPEESAKEGGDATAQEPSKDNKGKK